MKPGKTLIINLATLSILALISVACRSATPAAATPTADAYPQPYPASKEAAPLATAQGAGHYPGLQDGAEVMWQQATAMMLNGEVDQIMQTHDLKVYLTLKDGRTLLSIEPAIDEVLRVIESCGDPCKEILVATE